MSIIELEFNKITRNGPSYVIAEIGHNHQGELEKALEMIKVAADCNVDAVKFQKRHNRSLFTKDYYNKEYNSVNSFGKTYGEHRENLEFGKEEYIEIIKCAKSYNLDLIVTAFDIQSVDFLEELGIDSYKIASGDVTNTSLIEYVAKLEKPIFLSTGAATLDEIKAAHDLIRKYNDKLCMLHCVASYPTDYKDLNLKVIETLKEEFPDVIIGYSSHDKGILGPIVASAMGSNVVEKHFTLNKDWKGSDHKISLDPVEMKELVENLKLTNLMYGNKEKILNEYELDTRVKLGKSIYTVKPLKAGTRITMKDICIKTPGGYLPPYELESILGKELEVSMQEEEAITLEKIEGRYSYAAKVQKK